MVKNSSSLKIAVLDLNAGVPNQGMRCIKALVEQFLDLPKVHGTYQVFEVRLKNQMPEIENFDIFISSGGPGSPEIEGVEWEDRYFAFLDGIYTHNLENSSKKHLFLICHSFQLACLHWNLGKVTKRKSTAFGIMPVHKTEAGKKESLLMALDDPFFAVDSRDYQLVKPRKEAIGRMGASIICKEKIRPHIALERAVMGIRFSKEIIGVQFHPEADSEGMSMYFQQPEKRDHIIKHHGKRKYLDMLEHLNDDDKILRTNRSIIPSFLREAAQALSKSKLIRV